MIEFSELLKKALKEGKVKNLNDAFNDFPYEEWSFKDTDFFIGESAVGYEEEYQVGDIVYVKKYFYSDGRKGNNHMFVIVGKADNDNYGMLISSDIDKLKYKDNKLLEKDDMNNLEKNSIVKTDVIYKLSSENIIFKIGKVSQQKIEEYKNNL